MMHQKPAETYYTLKPYEFKNSKLYSGGSSVCVTLVSAVITACGLFVYLCAAVATIVVAVTTIA